ncbi:MAG: hypothetical protein ACK4ND_12670 [Cytophagaceae bacterium]
MNNNIIIYTKRFELEFDENSVAQTDVSVFLEELSEKFNILDQTPLITMDGKYQYISFKVTKKGERKKIGF